MGHWWLGQVTVAGPCAAAAMLVLLHFVLYVHFGKMFVTFLQDKPELITTGVRLCYGGQLIIPSLKLRKDLGSCPLVRAYVTYVCSPHFLTNNF